MQIPQVKILVLADIHGYTKNIPQLTGVAKACDVILLAGDITDFGSKAQAQSVLEALNELGRPVLGVSGNCDPPEAEEVLRQQGVCLIDYPVEKKGVVFIGFPCPASRESILPVEQYLAAHPQPFVLVSHQPAGMTAVDLQGGTHHKGSHLIRSFIEDHQPVAAISGHIHEARGTDQIGSTLLINPGPFRNDCYAVIEIGADSIQAKLDILWLL